MLHGFAIISIIITMQRIPVQSVARCVRFSVVAVAETLNNNDYLYYYTETYIGVMSI